MAASGFYQGGAVHLRLGEEFHHNRVRIVASQISGTPVALGPRWDQPRLVRTFMDQVRRGRVDVRSLVTDVVDAADVATVFARLDRGDPGVLQAVLRFPAAPEDAVSQPRLDTGPRFPEDRGGVAILGAGTIAQSAHLPAYAQHGVGVTGVWSRSPATTATIRDRFPFVGRVYASAEELLADPEVRFVDLATGPEGRLDWIEAAVDAGKHVLAQKPLTLSAADLDRLPALLARAEAAGVTGRGQPQRSLGTPVAGGDPAGARRPRRRPRRGHPPPRQAAPAAGRHAVRRRAAHAADRLPAALGRHHPHLAGGRRRRSGVVRAGRRLPRARPARRRPATRGPRRCR